MSTDSTPIIVGIDVSKPYVDFFVLNSKANRSGRRPRRVRELIALAAELATLEPQLVVLEATGGLETAVWAALEAAGLRVAVVNPKRVRDFARSLGLLAKTDRLDARVLALFGERLRPATTRLPSLAVAGSARVAAPSRCAGGPTSPAAYPQVATARRCGFGERGAGDRFVEPGNRAAGAASGTSTP